MVTKIVLSLRSLPLNQMHGILIKGGYNGKDNLRILLTNASRPEHI
jgi:hypothetical protein